MDERKVAKFHNGGEVNMPWIIKCWIPTGEENPQIYPTKEQAERDIESLELMQPENIYKAAEVECDDKEH